MNALPTTLPVDALHPDPNQPRKQFDSQQLTSLGANIHLKTLLVPIRVRWTSSRWIIVDGHRRWLAAKAAGLTEVPVIVDSSDPSVEEVMLQQLSIDLQRVDLNAIERGEGIQRVLHLTGKPASSIAPLLGLSEATVSKLLAIQLLPEADKARVRAGTLGLRNAYQRVSRNGAQESPCKPEIKRTRSRKAPTAPARLRIADGVNLLIRKTGSASVATLIDALGILLSRLTDARSRGLAEVSYADLVLGIPGPPEAVGADSVSN